MGKTNQADKKLILVPGTAIEPPGADAENVPDEPKQMDAFLTGLFHKVGPCFAYLKPDGWRIQAHKVNREVYLFSRTLEDWSKRENFPLATSEFRNAIPDDEIILDCEILFFDADCNYLPPECHGNAKNHRFVVLDALYLNQRDITMLPGFERIPLIWNHLRRFFCPNFVAADYTFISRPEQLVALYKASLATTGCDGTILKPLSSPYFTKVIKLKREIDFDAVPVGGYRNPQGSMNSLLFVVPDQTDKVLVPIIEINRQSIPPEDWKAMCTQMEELIVVSPPDGLDYVKQGVDIWFQAKHVFKIIAIPRGTSTRFRTGRDLLARRCILREDKGFKQATSYDDLCEILQVTRIPRRPYQISFF